MDADGFDVCQLMLEQQLTPDMAHGLFSYSPIKAVGVFTFGIRTEQIGWDLRHFCFQLHHPI